MCALSYNNGEHLFVHKHIWLRGFINLKNNEYLILAFNFN